MTREGGPTRCLPYFFLLFHPASQFQLQNLQQRSTAQILRPSYRTYVHATNNLQAEFDEVVQGTVERIIFRSPSNGYTVARIREAPLGDSDNNESRTKRRSRASNALTVVSQTGLATVAVGDAISCEGSWTEDPRYGRQFVATNVTFLDMNESIWTTEESTKAWLLSGALPGIGPKMTERLLDEIGSPEAVREQLEMLADPTFLVEESELLDVDGIGITRLNKIAFALRSQAVFERRHVQALVKRGCPLELATKVVAYWGTSDDNGDGNRKTAYGEKKSDRSIAEEKLMEDPHAAFVEADPLVGFARADFLCKRMDLDESAPNEMEHSQRVNKVQHCRWWEAPGRIRHGILSTLNQLTWAEGHCCTPISQLVAHSISTLTCNIPKRKSNFSMEGSFLYIPTSETITMALEDLDRRHFLHIETHEARRSSPQTHHGSSTTVVFPRKLMEAEDIIAEAIAARCQVILSPSKSQPDSSHSGSEGLRSRNTKEPKFPIPFTKMPYEARISSPPDHPSISSASSDANAYVPMLTPDASSIPVSDQPLSAGHLAILRREVEATENALKRRRAELSSGQASSAIKPAILAAVSHLERSLSEKKRMLETGRSAFVSDSTTSTSNDDGIKSSKKSAVLVEREDILDGAAYPWQNADEEISDDRKNELQNLANKIHAQDWSRNRLTLEQTEAVSLALDQKLLLVSGGPGTGKTETLRALVQALILEDQRPSYQRRGQNGFSNGKPRVVLTCPTARAAHVLQSVTGRQAQTIHRLLHWSPGRRAFEFGTTRRLEVDTVVVDEASMIDVDLMAHLCRALPASSRLILVGDQDQLPSVGPGSIYRDLMACPAVPRVVLTRIFRQRSDGSGAETIAYNAHRVNSGLLPNQYRSSIFVYQQQLSTNPPENKQDIAPGEGMVQRYPQWKQESIANNRLSEQSQVPSFSLASGTDSPADVPNGCILLSAKTTEEAADLVVSTVATLVGRDTPHSTSSRLRRAVEVQVLSPTKRGAAGTIELNRRLQLLLNTDAAAAARAQDNGGKSESSLSGDSCDDTNDASEPTTIVFEGDRVIQLINDYERGVFNGDPGVVTDVFLNGSFVVDFRSAGIEMPSTRGTQKETEMSENRLSLLREEVQKDHVDVAYGSTTFDESIESRQPRNQCHRVRYRASDLNQRVSLAYALTVHKAQGSEFPVVIVPLSSENGRMLQRTLLYTAMSRASELLVLVASPRVLEKCIATIDTGKRYTNLQSRLHNKLIESCRKAQIDVFQGSSIADSASTDSYKGHIDKRRIKENLNQDNDDKKNKDQNGIESQDNKLIEAVTNAMTVEKNVSSENTHEIDVSDVPF